jgi:hypothetical protein
MIDIVSVYHNDDNYRMWGDLLLQLYEHEAAERIIAYGVDNREENRGFAKACNLGALWGEAPVIGFVNPDATVSGPFYDAVMAVLSDEDVVITGQRYGKPDRELRIWGVSDWVCGACFFVKRDWFFKAGGFDEQFVWAWEETDLIRRAQLAGKRCVSVDLPIHHSSPDEDSEDDAAYKRKWFEEGAKRFRKKWGMR